MHNSSLTWRWCKIGLNSCYSYCDGRKVHSPANRTRLECYCKITARYVLVGNDIKYALCVLMRDAFWFYCVDSTKAKWINNCRNASRILRRDKLWISHNFSTYLQQPFLFLDFLMYVLSAKDHDFFVAPVCFWQPKRKRTYGSHSKNRRYEYKAYPAKSCQRKMSCSQSNGHWYDRTTTWARYEFSAWIFRGDLKDPSVTWWYRWPRLIELPVWPTWWCNGCRDGLWEPWAPVLGPLLKSL